MAHKPFEFSPMIPRFCSPLLNASPTKWFVLFPFSLGHIRFNLCHDTQVGEYITPLLTRARGLQNTELFLQACAASFVQSWRLVTSLLEVGHISSTSKSGTGPPVSTSKDRRKSLLASTGSDREHPLAAMSFTQAEDVMSVIDSNSALVTTLTVCDPVTVCLSRSWTSISRKRSSTW